jgi:hypothetical protein
MVEHLNIPKHKLNLGVKFMPTQTVANSIEKENLYLEFEQKFKDWRGSNPLPTFNIYGGTLADEADNIELFYEAFQVMFDELLITVFAGKLKDEEQHELYKQMNLKYGKGGIKLNRDLDSEFHFKYYPKYWALSAIKHEILQSEPLKLNVIDHLEKHCNKSELHLIIKQQAWFIFCDDFMDDPNEEHQYDWEDEDFRDQLDQAVTEFINRALQETKISYSKHIESIEMLTGKIEAVQNLFNHVLKGNFLTHSLVVEDKISAWIKKNAIAMNEWETVELEKLKTCVQGFESLFNDLINQWCEAHQLTRNHSDFDEKITKLYNRLKAKHKFNVMSEILETRQKISEHWQKLRSVIKTITKKKAVVTFIGG